MYYVLCIRPTKKIPDLYKWFVGGYLVFSRLASCDVIKLDDHDKVFTLKL